MKALILFLISFNLHASHLNKKVIKNLPSWDSKTINYFKEYSPIITEVAKTLDLNPKVVISVAWIESHFNPNAKSYVGALGIMQVKPSTQKWVFKKFFKQNCSFIKNCSFYKEKIKQKYIFLIKNNNHKNIDNIIAGAIYIKYLKEKFNNLQKAIIAYNMGPQSTRNLIKRKYDLNTHRYFNKFSKKIKLISQS